MKASAREQATLIIGQELKLAHKDLAARLDSMLRQHAASGRLHGGITIHSALEEIHKAETALIDVLKRKLVVLSASHDMHKMLSDAIYKFFEDCGRQFDDVTRRLNATLVSSTGTEVRRIREEHRDDIFEHLAIALFDFDPSNEPPSGRPATGAQKPPPAVQNKGGRPKADFWEEMWVAIASDLYDGTLQPKTQADIERAMSEWISARGESAADSTVRERARRLWRSIEDQG